MVGQSAGTVPHISSGTRPTDRLVSSAVTLLPVDEVTVTVLVDNTFDALLTPQDSVTRPPLATGFVPGAQFEGGRALAGLLAEHGFSALVRVRRGTTWASLLFDTGASPDAMATNAGRLGLDLGDIQGVVLSHGHFDHTGGFPGLARLRRHQSLPVIAHPAVWSRRRTALPGAEPVELPTLSADALSKEGFEVTEQSGPSLLADGSILVTGEVERTTDFELGMPPSHQAWDGHGWHHDATVIDDQALVAHLRGRGLVVLTGCGHAGVVNIVRYAVRLTGVDKLCAVIGGFHLSGPSFEPAIAPTVAALSELSPEVVLPGHCTGWRAQHALAAALPGAWVPSSSGTTCNLHAA
ncbi:MAG: MBL fold metallo-hydrolase [Acidimicrobiales bacterium]